MENLSNTIANSPTHTYIHQTDEKSENLEKVAEYKETSMPLADLIPNYKSLCIFYFVFIFTIILSDGWIN
jgi:hypothetical protein